VLQRQQVLSFYRTGEKKEKKKKNKKDTSGANYLISKPNSGDVI